MAEPFQKGNLPRGEQTEGRVSATLNVVPPGWDGPPLHDHDFDETFYVLVEPPLESAHPTPETVVVGRSIRQGPDLTDRIAGGTVPSAANRAAAAVSA